MATKAGVGMSRHHNPNVAGREAAQQALKKAGVERPDFVFMFASIGYDQHSLLGVVRDTTGGAPLSGCSVEGTIDGDDADESHFSVLVTAISSEELQWHNGLATGLSADSYALGQRVAQDLLPHLSGLSMLGGPRFAMTQIKLCAGQVDQERKRQQSKVSSIAHCPRSHRGATPTSSPRAA
jgi:hypothetical protein